MQPKQLGPFRIVRVVGRGGMGAVYEGIHDDTHERAAVKVLLAPVDDDGELRQRFELEIETLKKLRHPNIVRLYGFGEDHFVVYYVMELVDGQSLQQELKKNRFFTWEEVCKIGLEMSHALKHAHDRGIVHRDIKPANILLERVGGVKLSDFGIAHIFGESRLTHVNSVVGTLEFMSPEQSQAASIGPKTDLYALGAVLYTLLVGHPPFQAKTLGELLKKHQNEPPVPIHEKHIDVPEMFETLIMELLNTNPAARPSNAYILGRRLQMILRAYVGNLDLIQPKPSPDFPKVSERYKNFDDSSSLSSSTPGEKQPSSNEPNQSDEPKESNEPSRSSSGGTPFSHLGNIAAKLDDFIFSDSNNLAETSTHYREPRNDTQQQILEPPKSLPRETFQFDSSGDLHCQSELSFDADGSIRSSSDEFSTSSTYKQVEDAEKKRKPRSNPWQNSKLFGATKSRVVFRNDDFQDEILNEIFKKNTPQLPSGNSRNAASPQEARKQKKTKLRRPKRRANKKGEKNHHENRDKNRKQDSLSMPKRKSSDFFLDDYNISEETNLSLSEILNQQKSVRREFIPEQPPGQKSKRSDVDNDGFEITKSQILAKKNSKIAHEPQSINEVDKPRDSFAQDQKPNNTAKSIKHADTNVEEQNALAKKKKKSPLWNSTGNLFRKSYRHFIEKHPLGKKPLGQNSFPKSIERQHDGISSPAIIPGRHFKSKKFSQFIPVHENELGELAQYGEAPPRIISLQTIILSICLLALGFFIYFMLQPVPPDVLYSRIMKSIGKTENHDEENGDEEELPNIGALRRARENIELFITLYSNDPRCSQMNRYLEELELNRLQREFDSHINRLEDRSSLPPLERACLDALAISRTQPENALVKFQAILDLYGTEFKSGEDFDEISSDENADDPDNGASVDSEKSVDTDDQNSGQSQKDKFANKRPRSQSRSDLCLELIRRRMQTISSQAAISIQEQEKLLENRLEKAEELKWTDPTAAQAIRSGIIELYQDRPWAAPYVQRAKESSSENSPDSQEH